MFASPMFENIHSMLTSNCDDDYLHPYMADLKRRLEKFAGFNLQFCFW